MASTHMDRPDDIHQTRSDAELQRFYSIVCCVLGGSKDAHVCTSTKWGDDSLRLPLTFSPTH